MTFFHDRTLKKQKGQSKPCPYSQKIHKDVGAGLGPPFLFLPFGKGG